MYRDKAINVLESAFDEIASIPHVPDADTHERLFRSLVDTISDYPKTNAESKPDEVAACLYTSTVRNTMKLAYMGFITYQKAYVDMLDYLEAAFSLLTME